MTDSFSEVVNTVESAEEAYRSRNHSKAAELYAVAREAAKIHWGEEGEDTLEVRRLLADSYLRTKQLDKSIEEYREIIKVDESKPNDYQNLLEDVLTTACRLVDWGNESGNQAKITEAYELSMKYIEKAEASVPENHDILLDFYYNIGIQLRQLGRYNEASQRFRQVIEKAKKLGADGVKIKNNNLYTDAKRQFFNCFKEIEAMVAEREGVDKQHENRQKAPKPETSGSAAFQESETPKGRIEKSQVLSPRVTTPVRRSVESKREEASRPAKALSLCPKPAKGYVRVESPWGMGSRKSTKSSSSHASRKGSSGSGSKSDSTVASSTTNQDSRPGGKENPTTVRKRLMEEDKVAGRPQSAPNVPPSVSQESNPRPASASSLSRPEKSNVLQSPAPSSLKAVNFNNGRRNSHHTLAIPKVEHDKRSASVEPKQRRKGLSTDDSGNFFGSNKKNEAERWFAQLQRNAHRFLRKYHLSGKRVQIALLDTGVALQNPSAVEMSQDIQMELCEQVAPGKMLSNRLPADRDVDGHGSECAYLLTRVSPFAKIFSYRIAETIKNDIEPAIVEEALRHAIHHAVHGRGVDIISMSFGLRPTQEIRNLLNEAKGKGILMFAATSNDGGPRIKFPANSDEVFAIDAANRTGGPSFDNPGAFQKPYRFTALGEILSLRGSMEGSERRREMIPGSSFATPVAAATAAAILEFATQPPLSYDPLALKGLKMMEGMRAVLIRWFSTKKSAYSEFHHINLEHFWPMNSKEGWNEGGDCNDRNSDRYEAADLICKELKHTLDEDVGLRMRDKVSHEEIRTKREAWEKEQEEINRRKNEEAKKALKDAVDRIYSS
ncbi:hypothetical protein IWZ03DRAFT_368828 [Phyllosticta citriasiana]|uniref:Peptidase S8/S53 domain-containing protein n=1 Tax=Phyllosticta citriasiana TaxID=595635 RepID=A0ABR1KTL8_9PEZI